MSRNAICGPEERSSLVETAIPVVVGAVSLIADNACNGAWVRGPLLGDWREMDLAAQAVRVFVNGELAREGENKKSVR